MRRDGGTKIFAKWLCFLSLGSLSCASRAQPEPALVPQSPAPSSAAVPLEPASPSALADAPSDGGSSEPVAPQATPAPAAAPPAPAPTPAASESPATTTLRLYYADLNGHKFEAARYFAPSVKNYITMRQPSPSAIDHYIRDVFPKQFESYEFLLDETTLRADGPNAFTYLERSRYYVVATHEFRENLAQVRVELDADGKIVDFRHTKLLAREKTPELR